MLLALSGLLGFGAGLFSRGRVHNLLARRLRWPLIVVAALGMRELLIRSPLASSSLAPALFVLSLAAVMFWAAWHHESLPGIWLVVAGIALNLAVVLANRGYMPVAPAVAHVGPALLRQQGHFAVYVLAAPGTPLAWLGDWILLPPPLGRLFPQAYSPGDLVAAAGFAVVLFLSVRSAPKSNMPGAITSR